MFRAILILALLMSCSSSGCGGVKEALWNSTHPAEREPDPEPGGKAANRKELGPGPLEEKRKTSSDDPSGED